MKIDFYLGTDDKLNCSILRQFAKAPGVELTAHHLGCCDRLGCTNYPTHSVHGAFDRYGNSHIGLGWGVPLVCSEHAAEYTDVVANFGAIDRFQVVPIGK